MADLFESIVVKEFEAKKQEKINEMRELFIMDQHDINARLSGITGISVDTQLDEGEWLIGTDRLSFALVGTGVVATTYCPSCDNAHGNVEIKDLEDLYDAVQISKVPCHRCFIQRAVYFLKEAWTKITLRS
jgi:putative aminopeptidase FrvX